MRLFSCLLLLAVLVFVHSSAAAEKKISFSRHIKPILAGKCFACHGPDEAERKAEMRLDGRTFSPPVWPLSLWLVATAQWTV